MMTPRQCRAARALLDPPWSSRKLADESGVALATITRFETSKTKKTIPLLLKALQETLEAHGVRFIGTSGVDMIELAPSQDDEHEGGA